MMATQLTDAGKKKNSGDAEIANFMCAFGGGLPSLHLGTQVRPVSHGQPEDDRSAARGHHSRYCHRDGGMNSDAVRPRVLLQS